MSLISSHEIIYLLMNLFRYTIMHNFIDHFLQLF